MKHQTEDLLMANRLKLSPGNNAEAQNRTTLTDELIAGLSQKYRLKIKIFPVNKIPDAITWAERGFIAVHENYQSRRKKSYHIICADRDRLLLLCKELSIPEASIRSSDFYKFWHTSWIP